MYVMDAILCGPCSIDINNISPPLSPREFGATDEENWWLLGSQGHLT